MTSLLCPLMDAVPCYRKECALYHEGTGSCALLASVGALEGLMTELGGIRENLRDLVKVMAYG